MRVITFSIFFPAYHPRKGEPTFFVEKIVRGLHSLGVKPFDVNCEFSEEVYNIVEPKFHTIRAGNRWKVGDKFSPRIWSGKPYASKQIEIGPAIEIKKIWDFEIWGSEFKINENVYGGESESCFELLELIALNDGLNRHDLMDWLKYPKPFSGQIISWSDQIEY